MSQRNAFNVSRINTEKTLSFFYVKIGIRNYKLIEALYLGILSSWVKFACNLLNFLISIEPLTTRGDKSFSVFFNFSILQ